LTTSHIPAKARSSVHWSRSGGGNPQALKDSVEHDVDSCREFEPETDRAIEEGQS
jgi:hypothetical protein